MTGKRWRGSGPRSWTIALCSSAAATASTTPLSRDAFNKALATAGERAGIDRRLCHPHALRHAAGHTLANSGKVNAYQLQAVMGHKDSRSTQIYVQGVEGLIKGLWD